MAEKKPEQILEQKLKQRTTRKSRDLIPQYQGHEVVMELGDLGNNVSSGYLEAYDGRFVMIKNFKQHKPILTYCCEKDHPHCDLKNPHSVLYSIPSKTINVNSIVSIQTLEDVLRARG